MTRDEINRLIAKTSGGVDVETTERVLVGLEKVIQAQLSRGGNKLARVAVLYQSWKR